MYIASAFEPKRTGTVAIFAAECRTQLLLLFERLPEDTKKFQQISVSVADPRSTWWHDGEEIVGAVRGFNDAALCKLVPELYKTLEPCFITWAPFTINTSEPLTIARLSTMLLLLFSSSLGVSHGRIIFGLLQNSFGLSMLETTPELSGLAIGTSRKSPSGFQQSASRWTWLMNEAGSPAVAATLGGI
ncbi:hypothetical protein HUJ04_004331 [Dendroctonus ponderosae]|nr:hypothetical protein HUJ04_004331 [Dendroctonus ponderosae]